MKLVVTEKQKMGQLIASSLGKYSQKHDGRLMYFEVGDYTIVPLRGHVMNYVTPKSLERWSHSSVDSILQDTKSVIKVVYSGAYARLLRALALSASEIVIATDSDDEGENIGLEVLELLDHIQKPVRRLWLTTTVPSDIRAAFSNLRNFNTNLALSVEARRKLDAIVGFSGSRELTLALKYKVGQGKVLSFGRVQTATLWLAVQREREILNFVPAPYWEITARIKNTVFLHAASPFFDKEKAASTFNKVKDQKQFLCTEVNEETSLVQPPKPLNTQELLKLGSSYLHISPYLVISLAEKLYLSSVITYPRVDNQCYSSSFDHMSNLTKLSSGNKYQEYAKQLLSKKLTTPTRGRYSEDHEPITPIASISQYPKNPLGYRLYELVLRHYLSVFGPPAKFLDTTLHGVINSEPFRAEGRRLLERGFYGAYYYSPKEKILQDTFRPNSKYLVEEVNLVEKKTEPPPRFSPSSLLAQMEKEGIGTKSTRPTMIQTLKDRGYVTLSKGTIVPTEKGMQLLRWIEGAWGDYISPQFTSRVEEEMERVSRGEKDWKALVDSERHTFATAIATLRQELRKGV